MQYHQILKTIIKSVVGFTVAFPVALCESLYRHVTRQSNELPFTDKLMDKIIKLLRI